MSVQSRSLGYVSLAFLNISAIISLRHLPALATFGLWSILFYVLGAIVFLIPVALICAELATTWPQRGGLYNWVYLSMGPLPAFFAVWWSWMAAIVTILLNLTFLSVTLSYAFPLYAQKHLLFYLCTTLSGLWGLTFINIFGIHFSALLSSASLILGTLLPVCGIILLACVGLFTGQSDFSKLNLIDYQNQFYSIETFFFFSNVVVGYAGIELAAFHASDARNPQKDYSRAIFLSVIAIISLYVIGTFNAYNLLAIYGTAVELGLDKLEVLRLLSELESVSGRFQYIVSDQKITAVVDYAHTPDALENVIKTINDIRTNNEQLITVVGCGGDRDKTKRPIMAHIASSMSNKVIITSDNPRTEDPIDIIADMEKGVEPQNQKKTLSIVDRKQAIKTACQLAGPNDIILIAGKGHETYQEIQGVRHDFDDMKIVKELLEQLNK